jgi:hypothetical protein
MTSFRNSKRIVSFLPEKESRWCLCKEGRIFSLATLRQYLPSGGKLLAGN